MSRNEVQIFFARLSVNLNTKALVCVYGPFNYNGAYTSDSNARFDQWLKSQNTRSGIKDFEDIVFLASSSGFELVSDVAMPANNRLLVLQKQNRGYYGPKTKKGSQLLMGCTLFRPS